MANHYPMPSPSPSRGGSIIVGGALAALAAGFLIAFSLVAGGGDSSRPGPVAVSTPGGRARPLVVQVSGSSQGGRGSGSGRPETEGTRVLGKRVERKKNDGPAEPYSGGTPAGQPTITAGDPATTDDRAAKETTTDGDGAGGKGGGKDRIKNKGGSGGASGNGPQSTVEQEEEAGSNDDGWVAEKETGNGHSPNGNGYGHEYSNGKGHDRFDSRAVNDEKHSSGATSRPPGQAKSKSAPGKKR